MAGFYRSAYKNEKGEDDWMFSTQFESCDARQAFPWLVGAHMGFQLGQD
jgi:aminopeptidase N